MRFSRSRAIALLLAQAAWCETPARFNTPSLGYVPAPAAHEILQIAGVPGAAVSSALDGCASFELLAISPEGKYALASSANGLSLVRFGASCQLEPLPFAPATAIAFSPSGAQAAIYRQENAAIDIIEGLPEAPAVKRRFEAPEGAGYLKALAVSDNAAIVAALGGDASAWAIAEDGTRRLPLAGSPVAVAFQPRGDDAAFLGAGGITVVKDLSGTPAYQTLPADSSLRDPLTLAFSATGDRLIAVDAAGAIVVTASALQSSATISCNCRPKGLQRLEGNAVFALTEASGKVLLLDADGGRPRVLFVPRSAAFPL
jgi:hypothetical protein